MRLSGDPSVPVPLVAGPNTLLRDRPSVSEQVRVHRFVEPGIPYVCEVVAQLPPADGTECRGRVGDAASCCQEEVALVQGFFEPSLLPLVREQAFQVIFRCRFRLARGWCTRVTGAWNFWFSPPLE